MRHIAIYILDTGTREEKESLMMDETEDLGLDLRYLFRLRVRIFLEDNPRFKLDRVLFRPLKHPRPWGDFA